MASDWTRFERHKTLPQSSGRWRRNEPLSSGKTETDRNSPPWRILFGNVAQGENESSFRAGCSWDLSAGLATGCEALDGGAWMLLIRRRSPHFCRPACTVQHRSLGTRTAGGRTAALPQFAQTQQCIRTATPLVQSTCSSPKNAGDGCCARRHKRTPPRTRTNTRAAGDSSKRECRRLYAHARKPCTNERVRAHVQTHRRERMNEHADKVAGPDFVAAGRMNFSSRQVPLQSTV